MRHRIFAENLHLLLKSKRFEEITQFQWEEIILSLIADEIEMEAQVEHRPLPTWVNDVRTVLVAIALDASTRDLDLLGSCTHRLKDLLPTKSRLSVSEALTALIDGAYENLKKLGYKNDRSVEILKKSFFLSDLLDGAVRADVAEKVALDENYPERWRAVISLIGRDFRNSASPDFWETIEGQLSRAPRLVRLVMEQHLQNKEPVRALKALKHVPGVETGEFPLITFSIGEAIEACSQYANGRDVLRKELKELPPWVRGIVKSENFLTMHPEARNLLV